MAVIEQVRDPLTHMIRNSLDHGIETLDVRIAQGKVPCGHIRLRACHESGSVVVQVIDDGGGLDRRRIIDRVRGLGLAFEPEKLSDQDLYRFIFHPGFSTAQTVTDLSGRGVGMDIVCRNINMLRGSVEVASDPGSGTTITVRLPLTLTIINGLKVGVGEETY